jgi:hypothetical protein
VGEEMKNLIASGAIGLGLVLLIASSVWLQLFPPTLSWTPEKAARLSEVKAELNNLGAQLYTATKRTYGGPDPATIKVQYDALQNEFDQLKADFDSAMDTPNAISTILRWTGITLAVIGIVCWYAVKQAD